jgi:hypothetical protein
MDLAAIHSRHKSFHAEIARKAAMVRPRPSKTVIEIPNTPFGVPKYRPEPPVKPRVCAILPMEFYYSGMWFFDLISYRGDAQPAKATPTISEIQLGVCKHFGVRLNDLLSERRTMDIVLPRQVAMYLCKRLTPRSFPEIGRRFGNRDHSTVHHSNAKVKVMIARDQVFAGVINELEAKIGSGL